MATVSERSREILEKLRDVFKDSTLAADMTLESATAYCDEKYSAIIEQALLAERRLAWEAAIKVIHTKRELPGLNRVIAITALRAAAEKEVSK